MDERRLKTRTLLIALLEAAPNPRKAAKFVCVFLLLLSAAEILLTAATLYLGYKGGTYFHRLTWTRRGSFSLEEFHTELAERRDLQSHTDIPEPTLIVHKNKSMKLCNDTPPNQGGLLQVNLQPLSFLQLEEELPMLEAGGQNRPTDCRAKEKLAVIVPYRDRNVHLRIFLRNLHPFLQKQQRDYGIFIVELKAGIDFNRALLFNVGFKEAISLDNNYTCFIFHDVDLLPEDDRNLYKCSEEPRHMSVAVDRLKYKLPYKKIFGGVSSLTREQFTKVNGFSNMYFGWGGEDDDMYMRITSKGMKVLRYGADVARYKSVAHSREKPNPSRIKLLNQGTKRFLMDGLNSLNYTRLSLELKKLYTWILVEVDQKSILASSDGLMKQQIEQLKIQAKTSKH